MLLLLPTLAVPSALSGRSVGRNDGHDLPLSSILVGGPSSPARMGGMTHEDLEAGDSIGRRSARELLPEEVLPEAAVGVGGNASWG